MIMFNVLRQGDTNRAAACHTLPTFDACESSCTRKPVTEMETYKQEARRMRRAVQKSGFIVM